MFEFSFTYVSVCIDEVKKICENYTCIRMKNYLRNANEKQSC